MFGVPSHRCWSRSEMLHIAPPCVVLPLHGTLTLHAVDDVADQLFLLLLPGVFERARHALPVAAACGFSLSSLCTSLVLCLQVRLEAAFGFVCDAAVVALVRVPGVRAVLVPVPVVAARYLEPREDGGVMGIGFSSFITYTTRPFIRFFFVSSMNTRPGLAVPFLTSVAGSDALSGEA